MDGTEPDGSIERELAEARDLFDAGDFTGSASILSICSTPPQTHTRSTESRTKSAICDANS
jgi:hypothetical protein